MLKYFLFRDSFPDFMLIGAQKCGTSTLHHLLNKHPQLKGSNPKELHYFDTPILKRRTLKHYKKNFRKPPWDSSLTFESTPKYIFVPSIPQELFSLKPDLKFIVMLREPISRAYSAWNMHRVRFEKERLSGKMVKPKGGLICDRYHAGRDEFPSFEECIEIELKYGWEEDGTLELLCRGIYHEQLTRYFNFYNRDQFAIFDMNKFTSNTFDVLQQVANFLGIKPFPSISLAVKNRGEYNSLIQPEIQAVLANYYKDHNERLFNLLGCRFEW
jgi:hypothetical protein